MKRQQIKYALTHDEPQRLLRFFSAAHRKQFSDQCTPITAREAYKLKLATKWRIHSPLTAKGFTYCSAVIDQGDAT